MLKYLFGLTCCHGPTGSGASHTISPLPQPEPVTPPGRCTRAPLQGTPSPKHLSLTWYPCLTPGLLAFKPQIKCLLPTPPFTPPPCSHFPNYRRTSAFPRHSENPCMCALITPSRNHPLSACLHLNTVKYCEFPEDREPVLFISPASSY